MLDQLGWRDTAVSYHRRSDRGGEVAGAAARGFERRGRNATCVAMQVPLDAFDAVLHGLSLTSNVDGLLITMPHKARPMFERCGTSSERAKDLGAVSVARRNQDGSWHGDMLDGLAFVKAQRRRRKGDRGSSRSFRM